MKKNIIKYVSNYGLKSVVVSGALKLFTVLLLIVAIILTIAYNGVISSMRKNMISESSVEVKKVSVLFENFFREAEYLSAKIFVDENVKYFFSLNDKEKLNSDLENELISSVNSYSKYNTGVKNLYLYNLKNNSIFTVSGIQEKEDLAYSYWIDEIEKDFSENYKIVFQKSKNSYPHSVFFIKKQNDNNSYTVIELDIQNMRNKFDNLIDKQEQIYIMLNDEIVYSNISNQKPEWLEKIGENEQGYLNSIGKVYSCQDSYYYKFRYIVCSSGSEYMNNIRNIYLTFILILIFVLVVLVVISVFVSAESLYYITDFMDIFDKKKPPQKLKDNEIKYISDRIIYLINDNEKLKHDIEVRVTNYNEMQNKALQNQITPHFVNNSLTALGMNLIKEYGYGNSSIKMLTKLTRIIKYSYISDNIFVTVGEELSFLEDYLTFLSYRYENFTFKIECEPQLKSMKILKMILQPFAENAVFYGFQDKSGELLIKVTAQEEKLIIKVYDNGAGMSEDIIEKIRSVESNEEFKTDKIGIKNVYRRLKLVYAEASDINIESVIGSYTDIEITIPAENAEKIHIYKEQEK